MLLISGAERLSGLLAQTAVLPRRCVCTDVASALACAAELQMLGLLRPASHRRGDQAQKLVFPYVANGS